MPVPAKGGKGLPFYGPSDTRGPAEAERKRNSRRSALIDNRTRRARMQARTWRKEKVPGPGNRYRVVSSDGRVHGIYEKAEADHVLRLLRKQQG